MLFILQVSRQRWHPAPRCSFFEKNIFYQLACHLAGQKSSDGTLRPAAQRGAEQPHCWPETAAGKHEAQVSGLVFFIRPLAAFLAAHFGWHLNGGCLNGISMASGVQLLEPKCVLWPPTSSCMRNCWGLLLVHDDCCSNSSFATAEKSDFSSPAAWACN